jgi:hypothetical protein
MGLCPWNLPTLATLGNVGEHCQRWESVANVPNALPTLQKFPTFSFLPNVREPFHIAIESVAQCPCLAVWACSFCGDALIGSLR